MDIQGKTVLVLGGWGLVGSAICRKFMRKTQTYHRNLTYQGRSPGRVDALQKDYPRAGKNFFVPGGETSSSGKS